MRSTHFALSSTALLFLFTAAIAQAATISGTVTDKTTNKPSAGDKVVLVDVQAGMSEAASTTTDASGRYSIKEPGNGPYLVRVTHQGGTYFIAAPDGGGPGDIPVYDVAPKVDGVSIEADVLEMETDNGQLKVTERYFVHNTSSPPRTEYNAAHGFEIVLPADATVDGTAARRPTGLPTATALKPVGAKGHFEFDFPIQPDDGDKDTLFQISYHLPYAGKYSFKVQEQLASDNVAVLLPKAMKLEAGSGTTFQPVPQDPSLQTFLAKNVPGGKTLEFTVSGSGVMPRENQGTPAGAQPGSEAPSQDTATPGNQPGGGIGTPINTPDPLTKYKWWILGGLGLLLVVAAAFLLRKPAAAPATVPSATPVDQSGSRSQPLIHQPPITPASRNNALLNVLKEELFSLESEKLSGTLPQDEYLEQKAALETVLRRALKNRA